jgi:probable HAF family extracellular repeat protein
MRWGWVCGSLGVKGALMRRLLLFLGAVAVVAVGVVLVAGASGSVGSGQARWVIRDLGTLGGEYSDAFAVNGRGQIVGYADTKAKDKNGDFYAHAFLWENGKMRDLGTLGGKASKAVAINERGQIVGDSGTGKGTTHAVLWQNGKMIDLGTLPGGKNSTAVAINEHGQVIGSSGTASGWGHAFLWEKGRMTDLGTLPGGKFSSAADINEQGQVVGSSDSRIKQDYSAVFAGSPGHGFLWQKGRMTDLGTVSTKDRNSAAVAINERGQIAAYSWHTVKSGDPDTDKYDATYSQGFLWQNGKVTALTGQPFSDVAAINEHGQIVGTSYPASGLVYDGRDWGAYLWQSGKLTDLGSLPDEYESFAEASAINERGQVVGSSLERAFVWQNGKMTALGRPGGEQSSADAINESGQIVGWSNTRQDEYGDWIGIHAVLWTLRSG